jgi:hypothetical protein
LTDKERPFTSSLSELMKKDRIEYEQQKKKKMKKESRNGV